MRATDVLGITIMSIRPEYQGQGLGSLLMQHICEDMDRHGRHGYVLASPAGVGLYSKFGFEIVGRVETPYGPISSMLRPRQALTFVKDAVDASEFAQP
jgi:ribosomal protein S18 acetylase RimI-like enzyme